MKIISAFGAEFFDRVRAQRPVALELRLREKLVGRALLRGRFCSF
jgi:hypothetical protein